MVSSIIAAILAVAKAIPVVDGWLQQLTATYTQTTFANWKAANQVAVTKAVHDHDQIAIEQALGNPGAGGPSGQAGVTITNSPPPNIGLPN
jgi:hypothetical protein